MEARCEFKPSRDVKVSSQQAPCGAWVVAPFFPASIEITQRLEGSPMSAEEDRESDQKVEAEKLAVIERVLAKATKK